MINRVSYFILSTFEVNEALTLTLEYKLKYKNHTYNNSNKDMLNKFQTENNHISLHINSRNC